MSARQAIVSVSAEFLAEALKLPAGTVVHWVTPAHYFNNFQFIVEHPSLPEAAPVPRSQEADGPHRAADRAAEGALCEALGLDPRVTRSVSFSMRVGEVVTVTHERYVSPAEARRLGAFFARFNLVPEEGTQDVTTVADTSRRLESA